LKVVVEAAEQGDQQKKEVKPSALRQPTYPLIVSDADIEENSQTLQNIQWDLATKVKQCICGGSCTCMVDGVLLTSLNGDKNKVVVEAAEQGDQQKKEVKPSALRQPTYPLIVSDADIEETSQTLQNIQWDLATKKQKMRQKHQKRKEEAEKRISNDQ